MTLYYRSFGQYQGKNIAQNMRNQIVGGLVLRYIKDADGNVLFHEKSLSPKTVRPYYLLNGSESIPLVSKIGQSVDKDLEKNQFVAMIYDGKPMGVHNTFEPSLDGKLVRVYAISFFVQCTKSKQSFSKVHNSKHDHG